MMAAVMRPLTSPARGIDSASAAVAAQPIEENASAKVASRDEVWRRRNWLRRACTRNQSWIAVADAAATMTPEAVTAACSGEAKISAAISGAKMTPIVISTTSILARITRAGCNGAVAQVGGVFARYRQPGQAARKLPCRHHDNRRDQHDGGRT